jgi:hypothetical protein
MKAPRIERILRYPIVIARTTVRSNLTLIKCFSLGKDFEGKLFELRRGDKKPKLFLYDVTSSYLEGEQNYFGEYGYNRDGKKGKREVVIGMLCDECGGPVSTEVFAGKYLGYEDL